LRPKTVVVYAVLMYNEEGERKRGVAMNSTVEHRIRWKIVLLLLAVLLSSILFQYWILTSIMNEKKENKVQEAYIYGQNIANAIQLTLDNTLVASETLKYFYLQYGEEFFYDFHEVAANITAHNPVIGSLYIAPKGVIRVAYPEEVNAATIGFKMLEDPEQGPRALLAKNTRKITVAGPHALVEGGVGFIIRNPVYVGEEFIGFTIIVLDWDRFVGKMLENVQSTSESYKFAVWKQDHDETAVTDRDGYILRNSPEKISDQVTIEFEVPNDTWNLNVEPMDGWQVYDEMTTSLRLSILVSTGMYVFIVFLIYYNDRKKQFQKEQLENQAYSRYADQLTKALEQAKRADAAKSAFLSRMSHDIRTPLHGIIGLLEINEKHSDNRTLVDENRAKMRVAADHLLSLISDVLELSKMESEDVQLAHEPFDVLQLASDVMTITQLRASEAGIRLEHPDCTDQLVCPCVYGSPLHVRQILINIFSNAIKYNKPNGLIYCKAETVNQNEDTVVYRVTVSDTGIGMSEQFMEHMFEPFSQENNDARSTYQGTGLGMAIVKQLVDKMNGTIEVTSKKNEGSTFVITIPFEIADPALLPSPKAEPAELNLSGVRILLAEDNELNMEIAKAILEDAGASVYEVMNGWDAVQAFEQNPPGTYDLILLDIMMPVLNGLDATREIRSFQREDAETIPIFAMTANAFAEDVAKCLEAGMNGHIAKPLDVDKMMRTLVNALHKGKDSRETNNML